ncbi:MAG: septal ring lytic transglycosylase RlpA family protein [Solirubrobacteraceae bacterium MAG38_C4-C5]|nr:septal ring lytic transglycosylase RlpA family protein [Candidatus Siliceabacter maunaloa]
MHTNRPARATVALGALATAGTLAAATAPAAAQIPDRGAGIAFQVDDDRLRYGESIDVRGRAADRDEGTLVSLLYRGDTLDDWIELDVDELDGEGRFRLEGENRRRSGETRVVVGRETARAAVNGDGLAPERTSDAVGITIASQLRADEADEATAVRAGGTARVTGRLLPGFEGREVVLEGRDGDGWRTLDRATTREGGRFTVSHLQQRSEAFEVRVRFEEDEINTGWHDTPGRMAFLSRDGASWYGPGFYGRRTACGQTLTGDIKGVAHKTLPCGTRVVFKRGDRTVTARVIDRGPYVGGRQWDLAPAIKQALGYSGDGPVWAAVDR